MMLADPCRMEPDRLGIKRLVEDVGDQLIGATPIVELDGNGTVTAINTYGAAGLVSLLLE